MWRTDRDYRRRLLEEYWSTEWPTVEQDFREMKKLGANVVRVDLLCWLGAFMKLYLDITGSGSYREKGAPTWYGAMPEGARWAAQAQFWEAIAKTCAGRPGVIAYNLMNEPVRP